MSDWLLEAAASYNQDSYEQRERYSTHLLIPIETMSTVIRWSMESIPDEVLIGFDPDPERANPNDVEMVFGPSQTTFSGCGFLLVTHQIVNIGASSSVLHLPPESTDGGSPV